MIFEEMEVHQRRSKIRHGVHNVPPVLPVPSSLSFRQGVIRPIKSSYISQLVTAPDLSAVYPSAVFRSHA